MPSTCGAQTGKSSQRNYATDFSAPMARLLIIEPITKASIKKAGRIGADCSGAMCPVSGFDTTAQGYYNKCMTKGGISSIPMNTPCLVFKGKSTSAIHHMGFYLGNGYVIEMKSSKENCVRDKLEGNGWNWYGIPSWIDYSPSVSGDEIPKITKCVDVSCYQGDIDWNLVRSDGVRHAILKVIRKDLKPDSKSEQNWKGCQEADIRVDGVYNYSYATTVPKAKSDAREVLSVLNGRKCTIWLDLEDKCQQKLGSLLKDIINAYQDVVVSSGYEFGIYTGHPSTTHLSNHIFHRSRATNGGWPDITTLIVKWRYPSIRMNNIIPSS